MAELDFIIELTTKVDNYYCAEAVCAGGAMRDLFLKVTPKDYDLFVFPKPTELNNFIETLKKDFPDIRSIGSETFEEDGYQNLEIYDVYECVYRNKKVQVIIMNIPLDNLLESFGIGSSQVMYKNYSIYMLPEFTEFLLEKKIYFSPEVLKDAYLKRMEEKFSKPEYIWLG